VANGDQPTERAPVPGQDTVATARAKFHCPACGAEANWNPTKQALICPFCGTESPADLQTRDASTVILEHDLAAALAGASATRGWATQKTQARCQSCQAISVFDATMVGRRCDFCGSAQLVPYEETEDTIRPESLLPLKISEPQARDLIRGWYRRQWLAPNKLASKAITDTVHGLYLPYWTFDAKANAHWTAESGTYYYTRENGKQVRRVRWSPAAGDLSHVFDDDLVPGSMGVHTRLLRGVEPFPTDTLVPYDPGYLAGWTVERYQIDLRAAAAQAKQQMQNTLRRLCADQVPGDTQRNLQVQAAFSDERFKHVLVPVWMVSYMYGARSFQVVVNGVTGRAAGEHPWSWVKIALLVLLALIILYVIASAQ
jgi:hypothetical protein